MEKVDLEDGSGGSSSEENSGSDSDSSSEGDSKPKGVSGLIQIENPNRMPKKAVGKYYFLLRPYQLLYSILPILMVL